MVNQILTYWKKIKKKKKHVPINYTHIPKTGGTFVKYVLGSTKIKPTSMYTEGSHPKNKNIKYINFTVIRHPVDRIESYLNFKYGMNKHKLDTIKIKASLNKIVSNMNKKQLKQLKKKFKPMKYYSKNVDIFITINMLKYFLLFFGYNIDLEDIKYKNVSAKVRGSLNKKNRAIIEYLYKEDMNLYNNLKRKKLIYEPIN
jgi:hypothetical protein